MDWNYIIYLGIGLSIVVILFSFYKLTEDFWLGLIGTAGL